MFKKSLFVSQAWWTMDEIQSCVEPTGVNGVSSLGYCLRPVLISTSRLLLWSIPQRVCCQLGSHVGAALPNVAQQATPAAVGRDAPGISPIFLNGTSHPTRAHPPLKAV